MSRKLVLFLIVSTIILAMTTFGVMLALGRRPAVDPAQTAALTATAQAAAQAVGDGSYVLFVDNTQVTVRLAPAAEIRLQSELALPDTAQPEIQATPVPVDVLPLATMPPAPTAIPIAPTVIIAPTATTPPIVPALVDPIIFVAYTVQPGDTLYTISIAQNSSIVLMSIYGIDANNLTPGNVINRLPVANPAYCPGYHTYVVREGDTTYSIAHRLYTTHQFLRDLNKLDANYSIQIGQVLCVP